MIVTIDQLKGDAKKALLRLQEGFYFTVHDDLLMASEVSYRLPSGCYANSLYGFKARIYCFFRFDISSIKNMSACNQDDDKGEKYLLAHLVRGSESYWVHFTINNLVTNQQKAFENKVLKTKRYLNVGDSSPIVYVDTLNPDALIADHLDVEKLKTIIQIQPHPKNLKKSQRPKNLTLLKKELPEGIELIIKDLKPYRVFGLEHPVIEGRVALKKGQHQSMEYVLLVEGFKETDKWSPNIENLNYWSSKLEDYASPVYWDSGTVNGYGQIKASEIKTNEQLIQYMDEDFMVFCYFFRHYQPIEVKLLKIVEDGALDHEGSLKVEIEFNWKKAPEIKTTKVVKLYGFMPTETKKES